MKSDYIKILYVIQVVLLFFCSNQNFAQTKSINNSKSKKKVRAIPFVVITNGSEVINFKTFLGDSSFAFKPDYEETSYHGRTLYRKTFFSEEKKKIKNEFFRIDSTRFMYKGFDSNQNIIQQGVVRLSKKPYLFDTSEALDKNWNVIRYEVRYNGSH